MLSGGEGGEVRADLRGAPVRYRMVGIAVRSTPIIPRNARGWMPSLPVSYRRSQSGSTRFPRSCRGHVRAAVRDIVRRCQALDLGHHPDLAVVDLLGQEVVALHGLFEGYCRWYRQECGSDGVGLELHQAPLQGSWGAIMSRRPAERRTQHAVMATASEWARIRELAAAADMDLSRVDRRTCSAPIGAVNH